MTSCLPPETTLSSLADAIAAQVGPRYVGGYFWWYFYEDAVDAPEESSLWPTLDALLNDL